MLSALLRELGAAIANSPSIMSKVVFTFAGYIKSMYTLVRGLNVGPRFSFWCRNTC
jgi:hypothetical protein